MIVMVNAYMLVVMNDETYSVNHSTRFIFYLYENSKCTFRCRDGVKQLVMAVHAMSERKREKENFS